MGGSRKLQLPEFDKGSFYNQANWIEEYEYDKGLYYNNYEHDFDGESYESDSAINTLQAVITSATRCKAYHEPVCLVEDRKVAVRLTFLLKIEFLNQKCKLTNNNPTMQMIEKVDLSMT